MDIRSAFDRTNAGAFQEHPKRKYGPFHRQGHRAQRFFVGFRVRLAAPTAKEPAKAVAMLTKTAAVDIAWRAGYFHGRLGYGFQILNIHQAVDVFKLKMR